MLFIAVYIHSEKQTKFLILTLEENSGILPLK
jgi:hypothetical protein